MNFTSPLFLIGFPLVCLLYRRLQSTPPVKSEQGSTLFSRQDLLLTASWLFYMGGSLKCFPLLLAVTLITYLGGIAISQVRSAQGSRSRNILILVLVLVLSILFFFKYCGFVQSNLFRLTGMNGRGLSLPLPPGISFYSFQSLSYCIDVYRGKIEPARRFRSYALFVSFFPQLVAGPIERAGDLLPQLKACPLPSKSDNLAGAFLVLRGFFKKIVIADFVSVYVSALFEAGRYSGPVTITAGILFGFQIYADFSGYSDIALGAARLLGIRLSVNFESPYLADSIRSFWRRWHITLTRWFMDYVYIPLGGSRRQRAVQVRNVLIVFLLSGFWHGADWHFAVWGLYHGVLLSCGILAGALSGESSGKHAGSNRSPVRLLRIGTTYLLTSLGWVLFRASSIRQALSMYAELTSGWNTPSSLLAAFNASGAPVNAACLVRIALIPVLMYLIRVVPCKEDSAFNEKKNILLETTAFLMAAVILVSWIGNLSGGAGNDFIYFRF